MRLLSPLITLQPVQEAAKSYDAKTAAALHSADHKSKLDHARAAPALVKESVAPAFC